MATKTPRQTQGAPTPPSTSRVRSEPATRRNSRGRSPLGRKGRSILVLATLIVLGLIMTTLSYSERGSDVIRGSQVAGLALFGPIERGLERAWSPIADSWNWTTRLVSATSEQPRLERRIAELEGSEATAKALAAENDRLTALLAMTRNRSYPNGVEPVAAAVIARSPTRIDQAIVIDKGSADGIAVNDPVMVPDGLIGRVETVSSGTSRVALILHRSEAVTGLDVETEATGIIRPPGVGGLNVLELAHVPTRLRIEPGDTIVTAGWSTDELSSIYPRGIPIGVVSSAGSSPADLYKTIQVKPFADFDRITDVLVLTGIDRVEE